MMQRHHRTAALLTTIAAMGDFQPHPAQRPGQKKKKRPARTGTKAKRRARNRQQRKSRRANRKSKR